MAASVVLTHALGFEKQFMGGIALERMHFDKVVLLSIL